MKQGTVAAISRARAMIAIRLDGNAYTVVELLDDWSPQVGEKLSGDLESLGGTDLRLADGNTVIAAGRLSAAQQRGVGALGGGEKGGVHFRSEVG